MRYSKGVQPIESESGFTLLETAMATMIMSVGLMGVMQLFVLSTLYNKSSTQTTIAATLAKRQMEKLLAMPFPSTAEPPPLGYSAAGAQLGAANKVTGYFENYYVDFDRNGVKGSMRLSTTPFYSGQEISYVVTWIVQPDNVTVLNPVTNLSEPALQGLRRITVRAEATQAGMKGNAVAGGAATPESAEISTILTPYN